MTGVELLAYVKQRLAEQGLDVDLNRDAELYDALTEARDEIRQRLSMSPTGSLAVRETVTLEAGDDDRTYDVPDASGDPLRVYLVRVPGHTRPIATSDYAWVTPRELKLACGLGSSEGIEIVAVLHDATAISAATTAGQVGLPVACHRAIGKYAAALALTVDEESNGQAAMAMYEREMDRIERMYSEFDERSGSTLRDHLMESIGDQYADTLY